MAESKTAEYRAWQAMRTRCRNPNSANYPLYGGRGISICRQWDAFPAFLGDVGRRPSAEHSIDRIDVNGNYEPGNVRWATHKQQQRNRRNVHFLVVNCDPVSYAEIAEKHGVSIDLAQKRINDLGWAPWRALTTPARAHKDYLKTSLCKRGHVRERIRARMVCKVCRLNSQRRMPSKTKKIGGS